MTRYSFLFLPLLIILSSCRGTPFDQCGDPPRSGDYTPIYLRLVDDAGNDVLSDSTYLEEDIRIVKNCNNANYDDIKIVSGIIDASGEQVLLIAIDNPSTCNSRTIYLKGVAETDFENSYDTKDISNSKCPKYEYTRYLTQNGQRIDRNRDIKSGSDYLNYYVIKK